MRHSGLSDPRRHTSPEACANRSRRHRSHPGGPEREPRRVDGAAVGRHHLVEVAQPVQIRVHDRDVVTLFTEARGELDEIWDAVAHAVRTCRTMHRPVFLRLDCVRLWGHAGSDVETTYRTWEEITAIEHGDPLLANARLLVDGEEIYKIERARVGLFRGIDYPDYPLPSERSRGGKMER